MVVELLYGKFDGEFYIIPCGMEDAPLLRGAKGGGRTEDAESTCAASNGSSNKTVTVLLILSPGRTARYGIMRHLCGRGDIKGDVFECELTGKRPG